MVTKGRAFVVAGLQERSSSDDNRAYPGSRFNTDGFCIKHDNVRLCKVTNNVGNFTKYQVLQKVCPICAGQSEDTTKPLPQLLDGAALSPSSNQSTPKALPPTTTNLTKQRHKSSSQERVRGEKGNLYHPPPASRRKRSQSNSQTRKYKQLPEIRECDDPISSTTSKLVDEIIKQIRISPPPKDLHMASKIAGNSSQSSRQPMASSTDFKQQVHDLSGLLHSIHMKDSADRLVSTIAIPTQPSSQSEKQVKSYNTIRDDASAKYLFRKNKRDQSSTRNHGENVVAFKQYLESVPASPNPNTNIELSR